MSHNPNTIKSQDDLSTTNDGKRSSDVLLSKIDELEKTKLQLNIALKGLKTIKSMEFERYLMANGWVAVNQMRETAKTYIKQVEEFAK